MKPKKVLLRHILTTTSLLTTTLCAMETGASEIIYEVSKGSTQQLSTNNKAIKAINSKEKSTVKTEIQNLKITTNRTQLEVINNQHAITNIDQIDLNNKESVILKVGARIFTLGNVVDNSQNSKLTKRSKLLNINFTSGAYPLVLNGANYSELAKITTVLPDTGIIHTMGNATLGGSTIGEQNKAIAELAMNGANRDKVTIASNLIHIYANNVTHENVTLELKKNLTIHGAYNATNAQFELNNTLKFANNATFNGHNHITFNYNEDNNFGRISGPITLGNNPHITVKISINSNLKLEANTEVAFFIESGLGNMDAFDIPPEWTKTDTVGAFKLLTAHKIVSDADTVNIEASTGQKQNEINQTEPGDDSGVGNSSTEEHDHTSEPEQEEQNAQKTQGIILGVPTTPKASVSEGESSGDESSEIDVDNIGSDDEYKRDDSDSEVLNPDTSAPEASPPASETPLPYTPYVYEHGLSKTQKPISKKSKEEFQDSSYEIPDADNSKYQKFTSHGDLAELSSNLAHALIIESNTPYDSCDMLVRKDMVYATYAEMGHHIASTYNMSEERAYHMLQELISNTSIDDEYKLNQYIHKTVEKHAASAAQGEKREEHSYNTSDKHHAEVLDAVINTLGIRLRTSIQPLSSDNNTGSIATAANNEGSGIAAGNTYERLGVWAQVVGGIGKQTARKGASGFTSNLTGGMAGADTLISDKILVGIALGNMTNNVKHKDIQAGDKSNSSSWILSTYGHQQLEDNWFIRGGLAYTQTAVNSKDIRISVSGKRGVAKAKYNIYSFGGEFSIGKSIRISSGIVAIPSAGMRITHIHKISYKETGNTGLNHKVFQKANNTMQCVAGLQVMKRFEYKKFLITPETHANIQYGLGVKAPKGTYSSSIGSKIVSYIGSKPGRVSSTIGFGIEAEVDSMEWGITYDANIASGYLAHQGSLKLKLKF